MKQQMMVVTALWLVLALVGPGQPMPQREDAALEAARQGIVCLFVCPPANETACALQGGYLSKPGGVCGNCPVCKMPGAAHN